MNGYQRCYNAINWKEIDRLPVIPQNSVMSIMHSGYGMIECLQNPEKLASAALMSVEKYGYDGIMLGPDAAILAEALGCETLHRDDDVPAVVGHLLESIDDVDKLEPIDLTKNNRVVTWLEATKILLEKTKGEKFICCRADQGAFSLATLLRGPENMMMDLLLCEDKTKIYKLLEYCNSVHIQFAKLVQSVGAHATTCGDAYCGPELISAQMYEEFAFPYEKEASEQIKASGIDYSIHICGKTHPIHETWSNTGATLFEVDHKTDILNLRRLTKGKTALMGNLDTTLLCNGTTDEVKVACHELVTSMDCSTGFVLSSGCSMAENTNPDNLHAMVEFAEEFKMK